MPKPGSKVFHLRGVIRTHKVNNYLRSLKEEKLIQQRIEIAERFREKLGNIESKIEVLNYLIK